MLARDDHQFSPIAGEQGGTPIPIVLSWFLKEKHVPLIY